MLSIGELAKRTGVKVATIRYYEQQGLIEAPGRSEGNQRRYGGEDLDRLSFIRHARDLGLTLDAIRDLIALSRHPERPCGEADRIAAQHLKSVQEKIARLTRLEGELKRIVAQSGQHTVGDCAVIRALGDHGLCQTEH